MEYENFEIEIKNNNRQKKKAIIITLVVIGVLILVSIVLCLTVFNKPNKEQLMKEGLTDYFEINDEVGNIESEFRWENGYITRDNKEKAISAVGEYAKKLFNDKEIKEYNVTKGQSVWIQFNSGIEYVYVPAVDGMDSSEVSTYQPCLSTYDNDLQKYSQECVDHSAENIQNTLEDYKFTNNYDNADVDIEKLSDIGKNKVVIWHGHGGYSEKTHSFIATGTILDKNAFLYDVEYYIKNIRYTDEYLNGELIFTNSGHVAVGYKFFNNHLSNIDGSMIYLGACSSGVDDTLAKAFLDKGASTVIGNSGSICTTYNLSMIKTIYEQMLCDTGSDNHYDTLQTALNFAFDKNGKYCCEEDKSHPIIFGDNNFHLSDKETDKTLNSNFVSGKYLICTDGKYICAKSDAIYYKESITANEKKISSANNASSLLSDGNIIYYVEGSSSNSNSGQEYEKKKVYKTTTKEGKSEYLFTSEGKCELIACKNNSLYYLDIAKSGNDDYKYLLKKYDIGMNSVVDTIADWSDKVSYHGDNIAYCIDNTIFVNEQGSLCLYNIDKDEYTNKIKSSDGVICDIIKEKICFEYTKNGKKYISAVDSKGKMKTSAQVPDNFDFQIMDYNGKYALFFNTDQSDMDKMFDLYKFDFESGKIETSQNEAGRYKNKNYFVTRDLKEPENIYFMYNLGLYDESTNKILNKKHDDFDFDITKQMWIVDGYVVDWNFNTYKIYDESKDIPKIEKISSEEATKIANNKLGGNHRITYIETVELGEKSFYLLKCENKIDDGNGKMHYSLDAYMVVSMDGRIANLVDYVNGKVVYVY